MIVGVAGLKNSGKDTVAAHLIKAHGFERKSMAEPIKRSVAALLNIPYHEIDKYKNDPKIAVELAEYAHESDVGIHPHFAFVQSFTFREFLQRYGTEAHRDIFGHDFWVDISLPTDGHYVGRKIVVTDVRFPVEAKRVRDIGGYVANIERPGLSYVTDQHRSEAGLPADLTDVTIVNNGTLDELFTKIENMLLLFGQQSMPWSEPDADPVKDIQEMMQRGFDRGIQ